MKTDLKLYVIVLLFIIYSALAATSISTVDKLDNLEQEMLVTQEELSNAKENADILMYENNSMETTINGLNTELENAHNEIDNLNTELSTAYEKIIDMQNTGVLIYFTEEEVDVISKTVWGEAKGLNKLEQSAVVWCILNYVDAGYGSIVEATTYPNRFLGYNPDFPVTDEIKALVEDVLIRWQVEKLCDGDVGRTLPSDYLWFYGDGKHNYFRNSYNGEHNIWNWDCWNPYE